MKSYKSIWPAPVYVGRFADGETVRMSFASRQGKALDFDRGRSIVCGVIGGERGRAKRWRQLAPALRAADSKTYGPSLPGYVNRVFDTRDPPAADLVAGYVEWDGVIYPDPQFAPRAAEVPAAKPKADPVGRVLASIAKLSDDQRVAVLAALVPCIGFDDVADGRLAA